MATELTGQHMLSDRGDGLFPVTAHAADLLRKIPFKRHLKIVTSLPRNRGRHDKYWAIVHFIHQHSSYNKEQIDQLLRIRAGHCDIARFADGRVQETARRINWGAMDETEFCRFLDRVVDVVATTILPGVTSQQIHDELAGLIGIERAA